MFMLENSISQKTSLAPSHSFDRISVARFGQWQPDLENIISERSMIDGQKNYQRVRREASVF